MRRAVDAEADPMGGEKKSGIDARHGAPVGAVPHAFINLTLGSGSSGELLFLLFGSLPDLMFREPTLPTVEAITM
jgi:hypothetical protein